VPAPGTLLKFSGGKVDGSTVPERPGDADGRSMDIPYRSLGTHVSEKEGDAAEGDGKGALPGNDIESDIRDGIQISGSLLT
jgi:hypothetical protein